MKICSNVNWDTPAHHMVTEYMSLMKLHRTILDKRLKQTGVYRSQHQILMMTAQNPNASQKEIAKWLHVSTATIAVSLKKLEKGGYIVRIVDQTDNRFNQICITKKGQTIVEHSHQFFKNVEEQMFRGFTQQEFAVMEGFLKRAGHNLAELLTLTEREDRSDETL